MSFGGKIQSLFDDTLGGVGDTISAARDLPGKIQQDVQGGINTVTDIAQTGVNTVIVVIAVGIFLFLLKK